MVPNDLGPRDQRWRLPHPPSPGRGQGPPGWPELGTKKPPEASWPLGQSPVFLFKRIKRSWVLQVGTIGCGPLDSSPPTLQVCGELSNFLRPHLIRSPSGH